MSGFVNFLKRSDKENYGGTLVKGDRIIVKGKEGVVITPKPEIIYVKLDNEHEIKSYPSKEVEKLGA
jgi:hypothetical protein